MRRMYQLIRKPIHSPTGEPPRWSFVAHGAAYTAEEAADIEHQLGVAYKVKRLPI